MRIAWLQTCPTTTYTRLPLSLSAAASWLAGHETRGGERVDATADLLRRGRLSGWEWAVYCRAGKTWALSAQAAVWICSRGCERSMRCGLLYARLRLLGWSAAANELRCGADIGNVCISSR
jgi:hypothetical protein